MIEMDIFPDNLLRIHRRMFSDRNSLRQSSIVTMKVAQELSTSVRDFVAVNLCGSSHITGTYSKVDIDSPLHCPVPGQSYGAGAVQWSVIFNDVAFVEAMEKSSK